jgi:cytochrome c oxidase cbb3-type subunit I/II
LLEQDTDFASIQKRVDVMAMFGVPYGEAVNHAEPMARAQAAQIAREIVDLGGPPGLENKKIVALIAYLQRLGTDVRKEPTPASGDLQAGEPPAPGETTAVPPTGDARVAEHKEH